MAEPQEHESTWSPPHWQDQLDTGTSHPTDNSAERSWLERREDDPTTH